jgi:hypothetical protein
MVPSPQSAGAKVTLLGIDIELLQEGQTWEETRHLIASADELSVVVSFRPSQLELILIEHAGHAANEPGVRCIRRLLS